MGGGPSHMDTWDLKPESEKNGGPFKPIDTSAPGVKISEHLPNVAKQMQHLSIIRSLDSKEGNHDRGTYMMHTGYAPNPTVVAPGLRLGTARYELGEKLSNFDLPHCISINTPGDGRRLPRDVLRAVRGAESRTPRSPTSSRPRESTTGGWSAGCRCSAWSRTTSSASGRRQAARRSQGGLRQDAADDELALHQDAFNLDDEPAAVRDAYGRGSFGSGCLMARRLVEQGVTYVEVALGGWDTHANNFDTLSTRLLPELDKGMGALVADLAQRGLLDTTTDRLDGRVRPDPADQPERRPRPLAAELVDRHGRRRHEGRPDRRRHRQGRRRHRRSPVGVMDVDRHDDQGHGHRTSSTQYTTPRGRPIKVVDGGKPIKELFG